MKWPEADHVVASPDGRRVACLGTRVVMVDIDGPRRLWSAQSFANPSFAAFSPGGELLAVKSTSGRIVTMDPSSGDVLHDHANDAEGEGCEIAFSPQGDCLVDGAWQGVLTVRRALGGGIVHRERFRGEMISRISHDRGRGAWLVEHTPAVAPGAETPAPAYLSLRRWPFARGPWPFRRAPRRLTPGGDIHKATLSPDGTLVALVEKGEQHRVRIVRALDAGVVGASAPYADGGTGGDLIWSPDGRRLVAVGDQVFLILDVPHLRLLASVPFDHPSSVAFVAGGDALVLGGWQGARTARLADLLG